MSKIHEYDPVVYPIRLWVTKHADKNEIGETFYFLDENGEVVDDWEKQIDGTPNSIATTTLVTHKESLWKGCLVCLHRPKQIASGVIAHESTHVTDWLCDQLGIDGYSFLGGEARAYFAQWTANCIEETLKSKK